PRDLPPVPRFGLPHSGAPTASRGRRSGIVRDDPPRRSVGFAPREQPMRGAEASGTRVHRAFVGATWQFRPDVERVKSSRLRRGVVAAIDRLTSVRNRGNGKSAGSSPTDAGAV